MSERLRPTFAEINLSHLENNFRALQSLHPNGFFAPMVKADGYGHGDVACAKVFEKLGAKYLGVALIEEGIKLRTNGIAIPILVFAPFDFDGADALVRYQLTPVLSDLSHIELLKSPLHENAQYPVHLKFNTGMSRLGFNVSETEKICAKFKDEKYIKVQGACTHLAMADDWGSAQSLTLLQINRFNDAVDQLKSLGPIERHYLNSAALLMKLGKGTDGARPGISLYGVKPKLAIESSLGLKPVMSLKSQITLIQNVKKGESVSYNATWRAPQDTRVGLVSLGYADGWPRVMSGKGEVLVRGQRVKQVGIICMDYFMIDLTSSPQAQVGDEVVLFGSQGHEQIFVEEVAAWAGTISYEILTRIQSRVPRLYVH